MKNKILAVIGLVIFNIAVLSALAGGVAYAQSKSKVTTSVMVDGIERFVDGTVVCYVASRISGGTSPFKYGAISCVK